MKSHFDLKKVTKSGGKHLSHLDPHHRGRRGTEETLRQHIISLSSDRNGRKQTGLHLQTERGDNHRPSRYGDNPERGDIGHIALIIYRHLGIAVMSPIVYFCKSLRNMATPCPHVVVYVYECP